MMTPKRLIGLVLLSPLLNTEALAASLTVNCDKGQSVNAALAKLAKSGPHTVSVSGTCSEDIAIKGFDDLRLQALPGAVLNKVTGSGPAVIDVVASSRIVIEGFTIRTGPPISSGATPTGIQFTGSVASRVGNTMIEGGATGLLVLSNSHVRITNSTLRGAGSFATLVATTLTELADVSLEAPASPFSSGLLVVGGAVVESGTFRGFGVAGIAVANGGILFNPVTGSIVSENNQVGLLVGPGSSADLEGGARFTSNGNGSDFSGGILVDGGALTLPFFSDGTEIRNSNGQGVVLMNNAMARIDRVTIDDSSLNGVVVLNSSALHFDYPSVGPNTVTGSAAQDIFCDPHSVVTGGAFITGGTKITCPNLESGPSVPLPRP